MKNAILIVDDSRLNRETLADILKDKYNIIEAEDGRSGLEVLEKRKDDIVLVILDIVMPAWTALRLWKKPERGNPSAIYQLS